MKQNPNNSNSNSSKTQSINSVTIQPNSSSKTGNCGKKRWKKQIADFVNLLNIPALNVLNILLPNPE